MTQGVQAHEASNLRRFQMNVISRIVALVAFSLAAASAQADIIRNSTGYPDSPEWVNGGRVMYSYQNGDTYIVTGFRGLSLSQVTSIDDIAGVMAVSNPSFNWSTNILSIRINIFSSEVAFAANPLLGDVYTTTGVSISNIVGTAPPAWGGVNNGGWTNRWVDLGFTPFVLQPGTYITSVLFSITSGFLSWTETLHDFGLQGDITANGLNQGVFTEYVGANGYTTGDAAVRITGTPVPSPSSGALLLTAFLTSLRRRRG
jgi:hypothetical protein